MPVDKTELANDLATSPEYQALVREQLAKKDFVIRTKEEDATFQDRFKADVIEREIPVKIKAVHDQYDKDTKELFGVDRHQDEKSYDYLRRAAKGTLTQYELLKAEATSLKDQIKLGDPTGTLKRQLEEAEEKARIALSEKDKRILDLENDTVKTRKESKLTSVYAGIKASFRRDLPPLFDRTERAVLSDVMNTSILKDGVLYMAGNDGTILKDASFREVTVEDYLINEFKDVVDQARKQGGAGSKPAGYEGKVDPSTITADNILIPESVKSKDDLMTYMKTLGIIRGTKAFNEIWNKHSKSLTLA